MISVTVPDSLSVELEIIWGGKSIEKPASEIKIKTNTNWVYTSDATMLKMFDPQQVFSQSKLTDKKITGIVSANAGHHTFFVQLHKGQMTWWKPVNCEIVAPETKPFIDFSEVLPSNCETVNLDVYFNDLVTNIFKNKYLSPRSPYTTLQIPTQGIGEWCHPTLTAEIDDSGLRKLVQNNRIQTKLGVPFSTPSAGRNISFTSLWTNFPKKTEIPLTGSASHAYLLMAGTTNHMQTHFTNGLITAVYTDGTSDTLKLVNPENWCPIEQDYFVNGKAFKLNAPRPYRLHLKTGLVSNNLEKDLDIDGVYGRKIDGGAGIILDMPLNMTKKLNRIQVETNANDVVIGLMSVTLQRK